MGNHRQLMRRSRQALGSSRQALGSVRQALGSSRQAVRYKSSQKKGLPKAEGLFFVRARMAI